MSESNKRPLTQEELDALTKDLQDVLIKHNAEMGVTSTINLMKVNESDTTEKEEASADTETEEGS